jgi:7-cyano-7-deazaguanine synthase in queuosine biosynthesis
MRVTVTIDPRRNKSCDCMALTQIAARGESSYETDVRLDFKRLLCALGAPNDVEGDLLFLSAIVYATDKLVPRAEGYDNWQRELTVSVPVADPSAWRNARAELESSLSFLTGDVWRFRFSQRDKRLWYRMQRKSRAIKRCRPSEVAAVSLLSGGLDSLIGVIDLMEETTGKVICVGHHDYSGGDQKAQSRLFKHIESVYPGRAYPLQIFSGAKGSEDSHRSRSFLFLGMGSYVASRLGVNTLTMPENGMIALNPPLTPARRGSCSTRTAHPHFVDQFNSLLAAIGVDVVVSNPYVAMTKGEMAQQCRNGALLKMAAPDSVSCGKSGRFRTWCRNCPPGTRGCGCCVPCLYRRAAMFQILADTEPYGRDVTKGEIDMTPGRGYASDFRDLLTFITTADDTVSTGRLLLSNGHIPITELDAYTQMVIRGKKQIRRWLKANATVTLLNEWGI